MILGAVAQHPDVLFRQIGVGGEQSSLVVGLAELVNIVFTVVFFDVLLLLGGHFLHELLHSRVANGSWHEERPLHASDGVVHADAAILLHQHFVDPV